MNREMIAYCAGLYEGEGTVGAYIVKPREFVARNGKRYVQRELIVIQLKIDMTDFAPIYDFAETFNVGSINGPYSRSNNRKNYYTYKAQNFEKVQYIVAQMWPWLSPRRRNQYKEAVGKYLSFKRGAAVS